MENVLFKISFPAEFRAYPSCVALSRESGIDPTFAPADAQTAAEAAHILHKQLKDMGKSSDDIKSVKIRTQEAAVSLAPRQAGLLAPCNAVG
jgi:2-methylcitrate dehydratase